MNILIFQTGSFSTECLQATAVILKDNALLIGQHVQTHCELQRQLKPEQCTLAHGDAGFGQNITYVNILSNALLK